MCGVRHATNSGMSDRSWSSHLALKDRTCGEGGGQGWGGGEEYLRHEDLAGLVDKHMDLIFLELNLFSGGAGPRGEWEAAGRAGGKEDGPRAHALGREKALGGAQHGGGRAWVCDRSGVKHHGDSDSRGVGGRSHTWVAFPGLFPLTARSRSITLSTCFSVSGSMAACYCATHGTHLAPSGLCHSPLLGLLARTPKSAGHRGRACVSARSSPMGHDCVGGRVPVHARKAGAGRPGTFPGKGGGEVPTQRGRTKYGGERGASWVP